MGYGCHPCHGHPDHHHGHGPFLGAYRRFRAHRMMARAQGRCPVKSRHMRCHHKYGAALRHGGTGMCGGDSSCCPARRCPHYASVFRHGGGGMGGGDASCCPARRCPHYASVFRHGYKSDEWPCDEEVDFEETSEEEEAHEDCTGNDDAMGACPYKASAASAEAGKAGEGEEGEEEGDEDEEIE